MAEAVAETGVDDLAPQLSMFSQDVNESIPVEREDQSLESHEVIELQTFSERKAWIEEKIRVGSSHIDESAFDTYIRSS